jgi:hypothetical protein
MGQWWDAAIAAAGEQPPADLSAAVAEELIALWSDLGEAMRRAGARSWSVECDGLVVRIVMLSRLTAATSWQWIPAPLLASGVYQGILQSAGHRVDRAVPGRDPRREPGPRCGIAGLRRDRAWYARGPRRRDARSAPGHPRSCRARRPTGAGRRARPGSGRSAAARPAMTRAARTAWIRSRSGGRGRQLDAAPPQRSCCAAGG